MEEEKFFEMIDHLRDIIDEDETKSEEEREHYKHCKWPLLYKISTLLSSMTLDLQQILESIVDVAIEITDAKRGFLILFGEEGNYEVQVGRNAERKSLDPRAFDFSDTIVTQAVQKRDALILPNIQKDLSISEASSVLDLSLTSAMCVPLIQRSKKSGSDRRRQFELEEDGKILGVLYVDSTELEETFSPQDINFFRTLANQATAAVIHTRLYLQATTDPLSGLYNRRQFELSLKETHRLSEMGESPFSLLMVDLDHFKKINDTYGHDVGDMVIEKTAEVLRENVRSLDICARYGGEEFSLILTNTPTEGAIHIGEKIRKALKEKSWPVESLKVTASIGASTWPEHTEDYEQLVKKADQALYVSKENGRDQVTLWSPDISSDAQRTDKLAGIFTGDYARDYRNVNMLLDTISAVNSAMELEELLELSVDKVIEAVEAERAALMLYDDQGELQNTICRDRFGNNLTLATKFSQSIPEKVATTRESIYIIDSEQEEISFTESMAELELRAIMCVPLQVRGETIGVLYADSRQRAGTFTESELPFLEALARQIALAIENARLLAQLKYEKGQ